MTPASEPVVSTWMPVVPSYTFDAATVPCVPRVRDAGVMAAVPVNGAVRETPVEESE